MSKLWIKNKFEDDQSFKVKFMNGMDIDDLKNLIAEKYGLPAKSVKFIFDGNDNPLPASFKIPIPEENTIGFSEDFPYLFSMVQPGNSYFLIHSLIHLFLFAICLF